MIRFRLCIFGENTMEYVCQRMVLKIKYIKASRTMPGTQALSRCCLLVEWVPMFSGLPSPMSLLCQILRASTTNMTALSGIYQTQDANSIIEGTDTYREKTADYTK